MRWNLVVARELYRSIKTMGEAGSFASEITEAAKALHALMGSECTETDLEDPVEPDPPAPVPDELRSLRDMASIMGWDGQNGLVDYFAQITGVIPGYVLDGVDNGPKPSAMFRWIRQYTEGGVHTYYFGGPDGVSRWKAAATVSRSFNEEGLKLCTEPESSPLEACKALARLLRDYLEAWKVDSFPIDGVQSYRCGILLDPPSAT
jgi:hypothetical protein